MEKTFCMMMYDDIVCVYIRTDSPTMVYVS